MARFGAPIVDRQGFSSPTIVDSIEIHGNFKDKYYLRGLDPNAPHNGGADPRAWAVPNAGGVPRNLLRGRITAWQREPQPTAGAAKPLWRSLNFLYNPNTITHQYSFNNDNISPISQDPNDLGVPLQSGQAVNWQLYFNRTYDVATDPQNNTGVMKDISALEYLMGSYDGSAVQAIPVLVIFGVTPGGTPFSFYGWIGGVNVSYQQFTQNMIPTVAMVDMTLTRLIMTPPQPPPADDPATAQSATPQRSRTDWRRRNLQNPSPQAPRRGTRTPGGGTVGN